LPLKEHTPQLLEKMYPDMLLFAKEWQDMAVFYNGAKCGASAPDHAHLQAVRKCDIPLLSQEWCERVNDELEPLLMCGGNGIYKTYGYVFPLFQIRACSVGGSVELMQRLLSAMPCVDDEAEPRMNVVCCYERGEGWVTTIIPRSKHRPDCYSVTGESGRMVSPGTLDMAGLVVTPLEKDFNGIDAGEAMSMLREVALSDEAFESVVEKIVLCHEER
jgi:ATP adenylyltransferase/5',5'''-P-1,P-4-tetraphosphate phosphorylase II